MASLEACKYLLFVYYSRAVLVKGFFHEDSVIFRPLRRIPAQSRRRRSDKLQEWCTLPAKPSGLWRIGGRNRSSLRSTRQHGLPLRRSGRRNRRSCNGPRQCRIGNRSNKKGEQQDAGKSHGGGILAVRGRGNE